MDASPVIVWFRNDLRLVDNPVWAAALEARRPVVPVFVWAPEEDGTWAPGGASRWWLHHSLSALAGALENAGSRLVLRRGSRAADELARVAQETGAALVWASRRVEPAARAQEARAAAALRAGGCELRLAWSGLLHDPEAVRSGAGSPYRAFTPFWRVVRPMVRLGDQVGRAAAAVEAPPPAVWPGSLGIAELNLLPHPDWASGLRDMWVPGETAAHACLKRFLDVALGAYAVDRDRPDREGTSRLSAHLHFGELSPARVWREVVGRSAGRGGTEGADAFLSELGWREFAHHLLWHFPHTTEQPLREEFTTFPWENDEEGFEAWCRGATGYPIVDAGLRQLWRTGWMHNRVRMIVASFLVKDLLLDWRRGASWFWDTLVDADLASNTLGWQWSAGSGADAAPYFRVFNPVLQGVRYDPDGLYVSRFVPELAGLPPRWIHRPWEAPATVLADAGVELGVTYPQPLVDHRQARLQALAAFAQVTRGPRESSTGP